MKPAVFLCLFLAACTPARLDRLSERRYRHALVATDLTRAFDGANDEAALRSLGKWIEDNHNAATPAVPAGYRVKWHAGGDGIFARDYFDKLEPSSRYKVNGLKHNTVEGVGVSLIGTRKNLNLESVEKWYPPEAITRSVTAVAIPGPGKTVEIRLIDRMRSETVSIGGKRYTLSGDFTIPFAALLQNTAALYRSGFTSMVQVKSDREAGFAILGDYDPKRTPLILIHGLFSTPLAWAELTNELWADPEIRQRYQIWHYHYPTNPPALYSARVMRVQFDEMRKFFDPEGNDPAMRRSVVIGHSMGGLLGKTLAVEPKDAFWDAIFTKPISEMNITPAERATLMEAFYWKPRGNVDRIIFCSVPFRGSKIASSWIGGIGGRFVAPNHKFEDFFVELERKNPGLYTPEYASLTKGHVSSITSLSPRMRSMEIMDQIPIQKGTSSHVITGAMDWVVHRDSATVANAESTLEVPAGHGSFHHPKAIAEIKRILKLPDAR
ncbi:MAG: alpha/beta hydrolase [Verrucomicrobiaceae bacterium]|nr:MAG: alpha/beta hydrolase [Verrucomicrobiaceae bacterium]